MLPKLSAFHYTLLSVAGSWLSWQRAFRWAINYHVIRAGWLLFRCRTGLELALNVATFLPYSKASTFRHCEVSFLAVKFDYSWSLYSVLRLC